MSTAAPEPTLVKQLKEHLQEQQEPFNLSTYLSERRCTLKKLSSDDGITYCTVNLTKNQEPCRNKQRNSHNRRTLKSLLYKLIAPDNDKEELSICHKDVKDQLISETVDMMQQIAETNWFSTVRNGSEFSASPGSSVPQNSPSSEHGKDSFFARNLQSLNITHFEELKHATDTHQQWGNMEDKKQPSPMIVSEDVTPCIGLNSTLSKPILSGFLWKSLIKTEKQLEINFPEAKEINGHYSPSQRNKRVLKQSRQLLFNHILKAVGNNVTGKERRMHFREVLGIEELGRIISEQLYSLGKQPGNVKIPTHLTNSEFSSTPEEWNYVKQPNQEICIEIGDYIMDEFICELTDLQ
ncbi:hypothetical protein ACOSQ2_005252 [Xanthoceras sorbifolium]